MWIVLSTLKHFCVIVLSIHVSSRDTISHIVPNGRYHSVHWSLTWLWCQMHNKHGSRGKLRSFGLVHLWAKSHFSRISVRWSYMQTSLDNLLLNPLRHWGGGGGEMMQPPRAFREYLANGSPDRCDQSVWKAIQLRCSCSLQQSKQGVSAMS